MRLHARSTRFNSARVIARFYRALVSKTGPREFEERDGLLLHTLIRTTSLDKTKYVLCDKPTVRARHTSSGQQLFGDRKNDDESIKAMSLMVVRRCDSLKGRVLVVDNLKSFCEP